MAAMPTPDLAVPYEAPRQVKTMEAVQPMAPKKGCFIVSKGDLRWLRSEIESASGLEVVIAVTVIEEPRCQPIEGALTA